MDIHWLVPAIFTLVIAAILLRPWKLNEAIPTSIGALLVLALGFISLEDVKTVTDVVSGAGITILSTILMSSVLDRAGFFRWAAIQMAVKANGSGIRLFVYVLLLSFCMTLFFNNDGSILISTPIILEIMQKLRFKKLEALPYLLGSALVATSSSAPIGVSNLANLIALRIVGLDLNTYALLMFLPSILGIATCGLLIYLVFRRSIPKTYSIALLSGQTFPPTPHRQDIALDRPPPPHRPHLPHHRPDRKKPKVVAAGQHKIDPVLFWTGITVVLLVRIGFFVGTALNIPIELIAVSGALFLLLFYAMRQPKGVWPILKEAPWHIIVFAFGMYMLVYSLHNQGLTAWLGGLVHPFAADSLFGAILASGLLLTVMSCTMNNLPAVMIGTVMLTQMQLPTETLQLAYLANVLGSDIGSLLLPMGTLASLLWFHLVSKRIKITWWDYMKVSFIVIPPSLLVSLVSLYLWGHLILG